MGKSNNTQDKPKESKQYQKIGCDQRKLVLDMLLNQKLSLQEVASKLQLKYCTVRTIQKTYEKEGRIGKKESRKKKLKVESILKISVLNPFTMEIQPLSVQSDIHKIYIDKQPSLLDQITLANQQQSLFQTQCSKFTSAIISHMNQPNLMYQSIIQNMLLSSQQVFKSILDLKPQGQIKQEFDSLSQLLPQFSYTQQPYQYQYYPIPYTQIRS
ncbi:unnamed protein product [Paramecium primaurelia]|uniref:Insertion element IS150 protein InsJ-like helix-turn-helix domain-containing protein n=1 Tax=Paramecium primaurelia TaxID=5886 RepID=A0A8S1MPE5_PARPR|nr:unnamed protein product [Paramecium primaurelia]